MFTCTLISFISILVGLTNPPSQVLIREIPHPSPRFYGSYLVTWRPPLFTGGLTQLHYNVTVRGFGPSSTNTNITSTIVYLDTYETSWIRVSVVNGTKATLQISENSHDLRVVDPISSCAGKGTTI